MYPELTFSTLQQLRDYANQHIIPNNLREITGEIHNNAANGFIDFIERSVINWQKVDIISTGGNLLLTKPFVLIQNVTPDSITWSANNWNEYYITNATDDPIALTGVMYYNAFLVAQTSIPANATIHVAQAENGAWLQMGGGAAGITSIGLIMPQGFDVVNSPLTSNGDLEVTMALEGLLYGTGVGLATVTVDSPLLFEDGLLSLLADQPGGVPILDGSGKLPLDVIPSSLLGAVIYQGTWNASTNTPALSSGVGTKGSYYIVTTAGATNLDGITDWLIGDWAIYDGVAWGKVDNTSTLIGIGTANYIPKWTSSNTLANSLLSEVGTMLSLAGRMTVNAGAVTDPFTVNGSVDPLFVTINNTHPNGRVLVEMYAGVSPNLGRMQLYVTSKTYSAPYAMITSTGHLRFSVGGGGDWCFGKGTNGYDSTALRLFNNGNLQVGSDTDQGYKLYVNGTTNLGGAVRVSNYAGTGDRNLYVNASGDLQVGATGSGPIGGVGTLNFIPKWTSTSTLGDSIISDNGSNITVNTAAGVTVSASFLTNANGVGRILIANPFVSVSAAAGFYLSNDNTLAQFYLGSSANGIIPNGLLIRNGSTGGINIVSDNGFIAFSRTPNVGLSEIARFHNNGNFQVTNLGGVGDRNLYVNAAGVLVAGGTGSAPVGGVGTINAIPKWSTTSTLGDSILSDNGSGTIEIRYTGIAQLSIDSYTNLIPLLSLRLDGVPKGYLGAVRVADQLTDGSLPNDFMIRSEIGRILFTTDAGITTSMTLHTNGNLGLGTRNPTAKLHIVSPTANVQIVGGQVDGDYAQFLLGEGPGGVIVSSGYAQFIRYPNASTFNASELVIFNANHPIKLTTLAIGDGYREDMVITTDGDLHLGTKFSYETATGYLTLGNGTLSPLIIFDYPTLTGGGAFMGRTGGVDMFNFGFNQAAIFGGLVGDVSGRTFYVYDPIRAQFDLGINNLGEIYFPTYAGGGDRPLAVDENGKLIIGSSGAVAITAGDGMWIDSDIMYLGAPDASGLSVPFSMHREIDLVNFSLLFHGENDNYISLDAGLSMSISADAGGDFNFTDRTWSGGKGGGIAFRETYGGLRLNGSGDEANSFTCLDGGKYTFGITDTYGDAMVQINGGAFSQISFNDGVGTFIVGSQFGNAGMQTVSRGLYLFGDSSFDLSSNGELSFNGVSIRSYQSMTFYNPATGPIIQSPSTAFWKIVVDDAGVISSEAV